MPDSTIRKKSILGFNIQTTHSLPPSLVFTVVHKLDLLALRCLFALCFSRYRSSLKSNTGTRSHLPVMAQMPSTVPEPTRHKTVVRQERAIVLNTNSTPEAAGDHRTGRQRSKHVPICLISAGARISGGPRPSTNLGDLLQPPTPLAFPLPF